MRAFLNRAIRTHKIRSAIVLFVALFAFLNFIAFMQARAMTHFVTGATRTAAPEQLGFIQKIGVLFTGVSVPRPINTRDPTSIGLQFSTHRIRSSDGIALEGWFIPATNSRGLVIILPSYASSKASFLPTARELHEMNQDVLLVDFRGAGGSTGDDTTVGYKEADDVAAAVHYAREHFKPSRIILFGESMGAVAAIRAQSLDEHLADALIVDAPFDRLLSTVENRFATMHLPSFPCARLIVFWGGVRMGYWAFAHNPADYAERVHCPVLQMQGDLDRRVTTAQAKNLFDHFAGPKQFILFDRAGHGGGLQSDHAKWLHAVRNLLSSV